MAQLLIGIRFRHAWRNNLIRGIALISVLSPLAFGPVQAALADDPPDDPTYVGNQTSPDAPVVMITLSAEDQAILNQKDTLADKYMQVQQGSYSSSLFAQESADFLTSIGDDPTQHQAMDRTNLCSDESTTSCIDPNEFTSLPSFTSEAPTTTLERNILWMVGGATQINAEYCGPAMGYTMLASLGNWWSRIGNKALSQNALGVQCDTAREFCYSALGNYFQTDARHETAWTSSGRFPVQDGLNRWRGTSFYAPVGYNINGGVTRSRFLGGMEFDINFGYPIAGNIVEFANQDPHLDQHPRDRTVSHWVAIRGYSWYGDRTHYVDSVFGATSISWNTSVTQMNHAIMTDDMVTMLARRGFVW